MCVCLESVWCMGRGGVYACSVCMCVICMCECVCMCSVCVDVDVWECVWM